LIEPRSEELNNKINEEKLDYGIIVYIGHGATQADIQLFQLNKDEVIKAGQFIINSPKQIILLESCRNISKDIYTVDLKDKIPKFKYGGVVRHPLSRSIARDVYDCQIRRCDDGLMICFACSAGQSAYNYFFSIVLLQTAVDWYLEPSRHCAVLTMDELFAITLFNTMQTAKVILGKDQKPTRIGNFDFPITVSRY